MMLDTLQLPDNLYWKNEFDFKPFATSAERAVDGALLIDAQALSYGQPIALTGAWVTRAEAAPLLALEAAPLTKRQLTGLGASPVSVVIDIAQGGIALKPVFEGANTAADDKFALTINLLTVEP